MYSHTKNMAINVTKEYPWYILSRKTEIWLKCQFSHRTVNNRKICNTPLDTLMCFIHHPSNVKNYSISHKSETDQPKPKINSPIKGWDGLSKIVQKMSKTSIIELSQLGQDWFNYKWFNITHTSTLPSIQPPTHPPMGGGVSTNHKSSKRIELSWLSPDLFDNKWFDLTPPIDPHIHSTNHTPTHRWGCLHKSNIFK